MFGLLPFVSFDEFKVPAEDCRTSELWEPPECSCCPSPFLFASLPLLPFPLLVVEFLVFKNLPRHPLGLSFSEESKEISWKGKKGKEVHDEVEEVRTERIVAETVTYRWIINNFSELNCKKLYSETFFVDKHPCSNFLTLDELHNPRNSYLRNDTLRVKAVVTVIHHGTYYDHIIEGMMSSATISELVDFRGLCKIEKRFVQLLKEACFNHPTLIENQQKRNRTQKFIEWSFAALGRVLHFLNTKSVNDMDDDACNELQNLWEELNNFGFDDLTWLELHVQFALSMKNHMKVDLQPMAAKGGTQSLFKSLAMCFKSSNTSDEETDFVTKERWLDQLKGKQYFKPLCFIKDLKR
ncbi:hypothetical protein PIB30_057294 [Stylosanthes scabra]|uniref:Uncharacterized protein n=1 Tax=Stylosanthes scabra TaxID=79078 RepID=A0ABU6WI53_9FABA|nr:hypothetical protein [Stylosanthes scabra]